MTTVDSSTQTDSIIHTIPNVVHFPSNSSRNITTLTPPEEVKKNIESARNIEIWNISEELTENVINRLLASGFNVGGENCIIHNWMICEAIKATIYKSLSIEHPLHEMTESVIELVKD